MMMLIYRVPKAPSIPIPNEVISRDAMARAAYPANNNYWPIIATIIKRKTEAETNSWHEMAIDIAKIMKA